RAIPHSALCKLRPESSGSAQMRGICIECLVPVLRLSSHARLLRPRQQGKNEVDGATPEVYTLWRLLLRGVDLGQFVELLNTSTYDVARTPVVVTPGQQMNANFCSRERCKGERLLQSVAAFFM